MAQLGPFGTGIEMCLPLRKSTDYLEKYWLRHDIVRAEADSVFIKKKDSAIDYNELVKTLSKETGLSISIDYHYKFLVLLPLEADEKIEVLKHYFGITFDGWWSCKDSSEKLTKGHDNVLVLVTQAIDTIVTGEWPDDKELIISKLLRQDIQKYRSLFPHVSAAIQSKKYPLKVTQFNISIQTQSTTTIFVEWHL